MPNFDGVSATARELERSGDEGEYVRRARQHEDLKHLYDAIEFSSQRRNDGWGADRGEMHQVILKRKGRVIGEWSRAGSGFVFRAAGGDEPPVRAQTFQDLSQRTAEIIAGHRLRREWPFARLIRTRLKRRDAQRR